MLVLATRLTARALNWPSLLREVTAVGLAPSRSRSEHALRPSASLCTRRLASLKPELCVDRCTLQHRAREGRAIEEFRALLDALFHAGHDNIEARYLLLCCAVLRSS